MSEALWVTGDTLTTLRALPDGCVDLVVTSPPFLALRSYLPADDPAKAQEIGQEATPGAFLDVLLDVTEELARVLTPHGSLCVELGDTYSGSGGAGGDYGEGGMREGQPVFRAMTTSRRRDREPVPRSHANGGDGWPLAKSLALIPESYRMALAYGRNPHTGRETDPWRIRNVVRWCRPNPPVGALGDKYRPATSEMVVACKSGSRWFDLDAVRVPVSENSHGGGTWTTQGGEEASRGEIGKTLANPAGAPPLDWWDIPTAPYKGSHYATWPPALLVKPILSMCPREVCGVCGEARRRITKPEYVTLGWTDCPCPAPSYRPGRVLDPFGGSGTTAAVATGHGRDCLSVDLDVRNADLARERVGMWLTEVTVEEAAARLTTPARSAAAAVGEDPAA